MLWLLPESPETPEELLPDDNPLDEPLPEPEDVVIPDRTVLLER
ncbi:Uncharacterized protein AC511_0931 [Pseudomonas coronafaciens pv. oryzae]|nr:Uncharacterized protein AC511_0931 [Pseudomonas coronafaciens pv. oryzae]